MTEENFLFRGFYEYPTFFPLNKKFKPITPPSDAIVLEVDGKQITGKWIYGNLIFQPNIRGNSYAFISENSRYDELLSWRFFPVVFSTVSQHIELTDKNDNKIFANDVIKIRNEEYENYNNSDENNTEQFYFDTVRYERGSWKPFDEINHKEVEIVGNIWCLNE